MVWASRSRRTPGRLIRCARCSCSTWRGDLAVGFPRSSSGSANALSAVDVASTSRKRATAAMSGSGGWPHRADRVSPPSSTERRSERPDSGRSLPSYRLGRSANTRALRSARLRRSRLQRAEGEQPERPRARIRERRPLGLATAVGIGKVRIARAAARRGLAPVCRGSRLSHLRKD